MSQFRRYHEWWFVNGEAVGSGEDVQTSDDRKVLNLRGCDEIVGFAKRADTSYNVKIEWMDTDENVLETETLASGVAAGTVTNFDPDNTRIPVRSPKANIIVEDAGTGAGDVTASFHGR